MGIGRFLPLVLPALLAAPIAAADGVVVRSVSLEHPVGSIVADGETLRLGAGQTLTVLDRSGVMVVLSAGAYAGPQKPRTANMLETAAALAAGPPSKAAIGGTRNGEDDPITACSDQASPKSQDACIARRSVVKQLRVTRYIPARAGAPAQLALESNFDGFIVCTGWNPSEDSRFLGGADPDHPLPMKASAPVRLPAPPAVKGQKAAASLQSVGCTGVSSDVWAALQASASQALTPNSAAIVLSSFSRMRGDTIAEARASATAKPDP
jgi:hypothetical protein